MNCAQPQPAKLVIVLGPGGVGKTTSSAGIASALAKRGFRTVVMTVDPARRLAQVLGLKDLNNQAQRVKTYEKGHMDALWVSQHGALEILARKHAPNENSLHKMLEHKFFRIIESQLGGIEEYLGIEKALTLLKSGDYDYCVLDTPPSRHALDFFDSPQHLLEFFDESILRYFVEDKDSKESWLARTLSIGRSKTVELFQSLLGQNFFTDLAVLLSLLKPLHQALKATAFEAQSVFQSEHCYFSLVGVLEPHPIKELEYLNSMLNAKQLSDKRFWMANKTLPLGPLPSEGDLVAMMGPLRAANLKHQRDIQDTLLKKISSDSRLPDACALLPCYSIQHLSMNELEDMGERAITQWKLRL